MINIDIRDNLSQDAVRLLENQLDSDEEIFWADQPQAKRMALCALPLVIFGAIFCAIPLSIVFTMTDEPLAVRLFPLMFIVIGLSIMSSPIWIYKSALRTVYAITQRRAVIVKPKLGSITLRSFGPEQLQSLEITRRTNGGGDLIFEREITNSKNSNRQQSTKIGFMALADVREAEKYIKALSETTDE